MGFTTESDAGMVIEREVQSPAGQDALYERLSAEFAAPLARLARAQEADPSLQQDLLQEIHIALWRSLPAFGGRCSLRTWVYRVAHNAAASYVLRQRRIAKNLVSVDDIEIPSEAPSMDTMVGETRALSRLYALIQRLKPLDREVFLLYLEGLAMDEIAEIAGLSQANTRTKLHRIRALLATQFHDGDTR